jgi:hypothetical protein
MKPNALLTIMSLLSIVLTTFHITDDYVRGLSRPGPDNLIAIAIFAVWLFGTLVLSERRSGYIIMLLGGVLAAAMPVLHMRGARYAEIVKSSGGFFFVWTLLVVGATGTLAAILAARALWSQRSREPR